jgi:hypothetical protein
MTASPQRNAETCRRCRFRFSVRQGLRPNDSAFRTPNSELFPLVKLHKAGILLLCKCSSIPEARKAAPFPKNSQNFPSESASEMGLFALSFLCILPIDKKARKPL